MFTLTTRAQAGTLIELALMWISNFEMEVDAHVGSHCALSEADWENMFSGAFFNISVRFLMCVCSVNQFQSNQLSFWISYYQFRRRSIELKRLFSICGPQQTQWTPLIVWDASVSTVHTEILYQLQSIMWALPMELLKTPSSENKEYCTAARILHPSVALVVWTLKYLCVSLLFLSILFTAQGRKRNAYISIHRL